MGARPRRGLGSLGHRGLRPGGLLTPGVSALGQSALKSRPSPPRPRPSPHQAPPRGPLGLYFLPCGWRLCGEHNPSVLRRQPRVYGIFGFADFHPAWASTHPLAPQVSECPSPGAPAQKQPSQRPPVSPPRPRPARLGPKVGSMSSLSFRPQGTSQGFPAGRGSGYLFQRVLGPRGRR